MNATPVFHPSSPYLSRAAERTKPLLSAQTSHPGENRNQQPPAHRTLRPQDPAVQAHVAKPHYDAQVPTRRPILLPEAVCRGEGRGLLYLAPTGRCTRRSVKVPIDTREKHPKRRSSKRQIVAAAMAPPIPASGLPWRHRGHDGDVRARAKWPKSCRTKSRQQPTLLTHCLHQIRNHRQRNERNEDTVPPAPHFRAGKSPPRSPTPPP